MIAWSIGKTLEDEPLYIQIKQWEGHDGKSIWAIALDGDTGTVASGGADSTIRQVYIPDRPCRSMCSYSCNNHIDCKSGEILPPAKTRIVAVAMNTRTQEIVYATAQG